MKEAVERFNTSVTNFNQTWDNFKNDIGPSVLDPLSHTLDKLDEGMKWAAKYPGDAAAAAATIAGSFAAFWLRARIMRGSMLAGGGGPNRYEVSDQASSANAIVLGWDTAQASGTAFSVSVMG